MARLRALTLCGACVLACANGLDDRVALLQASARTQLDGDVEAAAQAEGLQALLGQADVQSVVARAAAARPSQGTLERLARLVESGSLDAALAGEGVDASAPQEALPQPPELVQLEAEMRGALRRLAPDPAQAVVLLQRYGADAGNMSVPVEAAENLREQLARAGEAWRQNDEAHEEILSYLPKLYGLLSKQSLFEPLKAAANSLQGRNTSTLEVLADHFSPLMGQGAMALRHLGLTEGGDDSARAEGPPTWSAPAGFDPYIRLASHHGVRFSPNAKLGAKFTITAGFKNHFYMSQLREATYQSVEYSKVVARVGVAYLWESGNGFEVQFQLDFDSPRVSKSSFAPLKQSAVTLRYFRRDPYTRKDKTGYTTSYYTTSQIGPGMQYNFIPPQNSFKALIGDFLHTFDYDTKDKEKTWKGWTFNLYPRLGFQRPNVFANQGMVFSKTRYLPSDRSTLPDVRVRCFFKPPDKPKKE